MENTQDNQIADVADMKLLSGRAHEYVVNFRHRFLTYFALPLFLLFLSLALAISWMVLVPARSEYTVALDKEGIAIPAEIALYLQSKSKEIKSVRLLYPKDDGLVAELDCGLTDSGQVIPSEQPDTPLPNSRIEATLVVFANEDRFLFKLLDELAKNLKVKKPPVSDGA